MPSKLPSSPAPLGLGALLVRCPCWTSFNASSSQPSNDKTSRPPILNYIVTRFIHPSSPIPRQAYGPARQLPGPLHSVPRTLGGAPAGSGATRVTEPSWRQLFEPTQHAAASRILALQHPLADFPCTRGGTSFSELYLCLCAPSSRRQKTPKLHLLRHVGVEPTPTKTSCAMIEVSRSCHSCTFRERERQRHSNPLQLCCDDIQVMTRADSTCEKRPTHMIFSSDTTSQHMDVAFPCADALSNWIVGVRKRAMAPCCPPFSICVALPAQLS